MPSRRPSSIGTNALEGTRASLWPNRASYLAYRAAVAEILEPATTTTIAASAAVHHIATDVATVRREIVTNNDPTDLAEAIVEKAAVRLARIPQGSHILVLFPGGSEEATVKHFNDELLGPELTNVLIAKRDELIEAGLRYFGLADEASCISSNHKTCHYCITTTQIKTALQKLSEALPFQTFSVSTSADAIASTDSQHVISYVIQRIESDIQKALATILEGKITELLDDDSPESMGQIRKIREWMNSQLHSIKLSFGLSEKVDTALGGQEALRSRFWADQQAEWSARRAETSAERGEIFDLYKFLNEINTIRQETLQDEELAEFFETTEEDLGPVLKKDVIHNLRKWSTVKKLYGSDPIMLDKYKKLRRYYRAINGIDYINPWVDIENAHTAISRFESITTPAGNIDQLKQAILMDERDVRDCTPEYFHYQGTEFSTAYYVSFDAIGIGDVNARDIELTAVKAIEHLKTNQGTKPDNDLKNELQEIIMAVGQSVSASIRTKFDAARAKIETNLKKPTIFTTRGGDEFHILIADPASLDHNLVFSTIADIAQNHDLRATISYKEAKARETGDLGVLTDRERVECHFQALDLNERNNATIKEFEKAGLRGIVAIPGEDEHTAALIPYQGTFFEINNIAAIAGAIEQVRSRGLTINIDNTMGLLLGVAADSQ